MASFTQAQLSALEEAIAMGALEVQYTDRKVRYRSLQDMLALRTAMRNDLGKNDGKSNGGNPSFSKGFRSE